MAQILVRVDEDLAREVKRLVKEKYGGRRGALSLIVEDALRAAISPPAAISPSTLLDVIDYVERAAKEGQPKEQILTNVYIMLDREFEQSIIRGAGDMKSGRLHKVPSTEDSIAFLRRLTDDRA
jgi:hypothetical protein